MFLFFLSDNPLTFNYLNVTIASLIVLTSATWMRSFSLLVLFALKMKIILCIFYSMHSKHSLS